MKSNLTRALPNNGLHSFPVETPAFLIKLWMLLENEEYSQFIDWNQNGTSFTIIDPNQFSQIVLPKYFKHSHLTSFIRQLNMYGFRKFTNVICNNNAQEPLEFHHPQFLKGQPDLLEFVKRKSPSSLRIGSRTIKTVDLEKLITEFEQIKSKHEIMSFQVQELKSENLSLKAEVVNLKSKYSRHEQVLTRMMNFIILNALYPERTLSLLPGMKRRRLMLENSKESNILAFPDALHSSFSLNGSIDEFKNGPHSLLHPLDPTNLSYPQYLNVDNAGPPSESNRNSVALYSGNNYQGNVANQINPEAFVNQSFKKGSHIREEIRQAVLAKTTGSEGGLTSGNNHFQLSGDINNGYPNESVNYEQYVPQWDENSEIVQYPEDIGFDSSLLSELLLPNPNSIDSPLQNFDNIANPEIFNTNIDANMQVSSFEMPTTIDEGTEENSSVINSLSTKKDVFKF